jgi:predicted acyl esterase
MLAVLLLASALAGQAENFDVKAQYTKVEYRITMRDGVKLFTLRVCAQRYLD